MDISNQKNGRMGKIMHHKSTGPQKAVAALVRIVAHMMIHSGTDKHLLCDYLQTKIWEVVQNSDIVAEF